MATWHLIEWRWKLGHAPDPAAVEQFWKAIRSDRVNLDNDFPKITASDFDGEWRSPTISIALALHLAKAAGLHPHKCRIAIKPYCCCSCHQQPIAWSRWIYADALDQAPEDEELPPDDELNFKVQQFLEEYRTV